MQSLSVRPYVNWSQFKVEKSEIVEPEVFLSHEEEEETRFEIFRQLSHKVAGHRYDIPWGDQVIIAYCKAPDSAEPAQAIGVITFCVADEAINNSREGQQFMSSYFHTISFLFVDRNFQRKGVGTRLLNQAMIKFRHSGIQHPIHLEGAKPAVKFFRKMGFTVSGKAVRSLRGSNLFKKCFNMHHKF